MYVKNKIVRSLRGFYSGNILLITLKLNLSREFILMQNFPPFDNWRELFEFQTFK